MSQVNQSPRLFFYSILFPAFWLTLGGVLNYISPDKKLGIVGLVLIIYLVLFPVCWHFARSFKRHLFKKEKLRLIAYMALWAIVLEWLSLLYIQGVNTDSIMSFELLLSALSFSLVVDVLFIGLGIQIMSKRYIEYFLNENEVKTA